MSSHWSCPELWVGIPDFPAYEISDQGRVRRIVAVQGGGIGLLKQIPNPKGYLRVFLYQDKRSHTRYVHRLVLSTFVGSFPNTHGTNHIDGNKTNNALTNLEFKTQASNNQHAWDIGLVPRIRQKSARCRNGHELTKDNLLIKQQRDRNGKLVTTRRCRICHNINQRNYVKRHHLAGEDE